jgi:hypothetical protein
VVAFIHRETDGALPIIGVGGILEPDDAVALVDAGASLVQLYTGLIYRGPALVRSTALALGPRLRQDRRSDPRPVQDRRGRAPGDAGRPSSRHDADHAALAGETIPANHDQRGHGSYEPADRGSAS